MGGPWEKYGAPTGGKPWEAYAAQSDGYNMNATPEESNAMRNKFYKDEASLKTKVRNTVMPIARPLLEGGGALVGGMAGAAGGPVGAVAGGATGYAGGKYIADLVEGRPQSAGQTLADLGTGAMYEMGGAIAGNVIGRGVTAATKYATSSPIADTAKRKAGEVLRKGNVLTEQEAANLIKSAELTNKLGVKLTPSQMTGKPSLQSLESGLATSDGEFAATLNAQDSAAKAKALAAIQKATGKGRPLPQTQDLQATGTGLTESIEGALKPIKAAEREAWAQVPDYPMPSDGTASAIKMITESPLDDETGRAVANVVDFIKKAPKTTKGLQAIEQTIASDINVASRAGNQKVVRALSIIKDGVKADFDAMGTAAQNGDIALFNGSVVYPSKLAADLAKVEERIATTQATSKIDYDGMRAALQEKNVPFNVINKTDRYDAGVNQRMEKAYKELIAPELPTVGGNVKEIATLQQQKEALETTLANLQPAEDVASAYRAAKDVSKGKFDRFNKGVTKEVLKKGDDITGFRTSPEAIPKKYFTPSGADDLIRAVSSKQVAKEQMQPFVINDLISTAAKDGVNFNVQTGLNYIQKNRVALEKLGLVNEARQVIKDQIPKELERLLAKKAADGTGQAFFTGQDMRNILQKYGSTIKQMYGVETLTAFRDYHQLMGMLERRQVKAVGSNTADKWARITKDMLTASQTPVAKLTDGLLMAIAKGAGVGGAGGVFTGTSIPTAATLGALNGARQMLANGNNQIAHTFVKILQDATLNPETAKSLVDLQRTGKVSPTLQAIIDNNLIAPAAITATPQPEPTNDPLGIRP